MLTEPNLLFTIHSYLFTMLDFELPVTLWMPLVGVIAYLAVLVLVAEGIDRFVASDTELTRKIVHIGAGNVVLLAWWLQIPQTVILGAAAIASLVAVSSYFLPILPSINSVGRQSLGTLFYAVSIGILTLLFWSDNPEYSVLGILVMAWGDGLAGLIGQRFGKHPYQVFGIQKSWEGSLTMAVVTFIISSLILSNFGIHWQTWSIAALVATVATILEAFSTLGVDNLTVPLGSATVAYLLSQFYA